MQIKKIYHILYCLLHYTEDLNCLISVEHYPHTYLINILGSKESDSNLGWGPGAANKERFRIPAGVREPHGKG